MHKHFKRQLFTQAIYLNVMLNVSKHYLARSANHLPVVCVAQGCPTRGLRGGFEWPAM